MTADNEFEQTIFPPEPKIDPDAFEDVNPWRKGWFRDEIREWLGVK